VSTSDQKSLFLIIPVPGVVVIAGNLAKGNSAWRIRGRFMTYELATEPFGFWTAVLMYVLFAAAVCLVEIRGHISP
jgi:hypothetical protein